MVGRRKACVNWNVWTVDVRGAWLPEKASRGQVWTAGADALQVELPQEEGRQRQRSQPWEAL